jgi:hypothetical protein
MSKIHQIMIVSINNEILLNVSRNNHKIKYYVIPSMSLDVCLIRLVGRELVCDKFWKSYSPISWNLLHFTPNFLQNIPTLQVKKNIGYETLKRIFF